MAPSDSLALQLRFREHEHSLEPPDVDAFRCTPVSPALARPAGRDEEVGVLAGASRPLRPSSPIVVFFQHAGYGIPAIAGAELPDVACFRMQPALSGYLARVPRGRSRALGSRAAWVVAACLPLWFPYDA